MQIMAQFFGRFHPLLVHLPIGILFLAFIFEFLSSFSKYRGLRQAIQPTLFLGALFAIASAASGYLLAQEGGYDDDLLGLHRNSGIATAVFATLFYFLRKKAIVHFEDKGKRKIARIFLFMLLIILLSFTGHLGGSLTHGEDFLFDFEIQSEVIGPSFKIQSAADIDSAILYSDIIEPILSARCYSCHSSKKQKGQLRLDQTHFIEKGGKHGAVIEVGIPDSSLLYRRLMLPHEDEHHMPPKRKRQPSSAEIALVQAWIEDGASFKKRVSASSQVANIRTFLNTMLFQTMHGPIIPTEEVSAASDKTITTLTSRGILVIPVGAESNYLSVSFVNARSASNQELELLLPLKDQLLWLNVGRTQITDEGLKTIGELSNLTQLNLDYTAVEDQGLQNLIRLSKLTSLNLVGTKVGDEGLTHLGPLKSLKKIFLYKTNITRAGTTGLTSRLPSVEIDTGSYQLPQLSVDSLDHSEAH